MPQVNEFSWLILSLKSIPCFMIMIFVYHFSTFLTLSNLVSCQLNFFSSLV